MRFQRLRAGGQAAHALSHSFTRVVAACKTTRCMRPKPYLLDLNRDPPHAQDRILREQVMLNAREVVFPAKPAVSHEAKDFIRK